MELPKYYQGNLVPRSSTYSKFGLIQANHYGVIDGPTDISTGYSGNNDIWKFSAICLCSGEKYKVNEGDRICQFEIKPTMFAPFWVKLKWLFSSGIDIIYIDDLNSDDRGGFGQSGVK